MVVKWVLCGCCMGVAMELKCFSRAFHGCYKDVSRAVTLLQGLYMGVSRLLPGCYKGVPGVLQNMK